MFREYVSVSFLVDLVYECVSSSSLATTTMTPTLTSEAAAAGAGGVMALTMLASWQMRFSVGMDEVLILVVVLMR